MKTLKIIIFTVLLYFGFAEANGSVCAQHGNSHTHLRYGYSVNVTSYETNDCVDCGRYGPNKLTVSKNGKIIFRDSTKRYSGTGNFCPLLLHFRSGHDDLLLSTRENVIRLSVKNSRVVKVDTLTNFDAAIRFNQQLLFMTGHVDPNDMWLYEDTTNAHSGKLIYDPFLFYRLTKSELTLDTAMTESVNEIIYGKFYGFTLSDSLSFLPSKTKDAWSQEMKKFHLLSLKALRTILNNEF